MKFTVLALLFWQVLFPPSTILRVKMRAQINHAPPLQHRESSVNISKLEQFALKARRLRRSPSGLRTSQAPVEQKSSTMAAREMLILEQREAHEVQADCDPNNERKEYLHIHVVPTFI